MDQEYEALLRNHNWNLVPPHPDQTIVQSKWIFRTKYNANGCLDRCKARLVAKGFQRTPSSNFFETFNPVVKPSTIRIVLIVTVSRRWDINHIDVNNAFLNGEVSETVYVAQPDGYVDYSTTDFVCCLCKALYGLKQAPGLGLIASALLSSNGDFKTLSLLFTLLHQQRWSSISEQISRLIAIFTHNLSSKIWASLTTFFSHTHHMTFAVLNRLQENMCIIPAVILKKNPYSRSFHKLYINNRSTSLLSNFPIASQIL